MENRKLAAILGVDIGRGARATAGLALIAIIAGAANPAPSVAQPHASETPIPPRTPNSADLAAAIAAFDQQRYDEAFPALSRWANQGDAGAQRRLGLLYRDGEGAARDAASAYHWFLMSAMQGDAWAQALVGECYWRGMGVERDYGDALNWFRKAADQGNPLGENGLGILYQNGWGVVRDFKASAEWFQKAADQGFGWGLANLGYVAYGGLGQSVDYDAARGFFEKAAALGNAGGETGLGLLYLNGDGVEKGVDRAFRQFERAAELGDDAGKAQLADMLRKFDRYRDYPRALRLLHEAADEGNGEASDVLGLMYQSGQGVPQDYDVAKYWRRRSAEAGYAWGMVNLGYMLGADCEQARSWFARGLAAGGSDIRIHLATHPLCGFDAGAKP